MRLLPGGRALAGKLLYTALIVLAVAGWAAEIVSGTTRRFPGGDHFLIGAITICATLIGAFWAIVKHYSGTRLQPGQIIVSEDTIARAYDHALMAVQGCHGHEQDEPREQARLRSV